MRASLDSRQALPALPRGTVSWRRLRRELPLLLLRGAPRGRNPCLRPSAIEDAVGEAEAALRRVAERLAVDDLPGTEVQVLIAVSCFLRVGDVVERRGMGPVALREWGKDGRV